MRQIGIGAELEEDVYVAAFINGLDTSANLTLRILKPRTLDDAVDEITQHRRSLGVYVPRGHQSSAGGRRHSRPSRERESSGKDKHSAPALTVTRDYTKPYQNKRHGQRDSQSGDGSEEDSVREFRRRN